MVNVPLLQLSGVLPGVFASPLLHEDLLRPSDHAKGEFLNLFLRVVSMQTDTQAACRNRGRCYCTGVNAQSEQMRQEGPRHQVVNGMTGHGSSKEISSSVRSEGMTASPGRRNEMG